MSATPTGSRSAASRAPLVLVTDDVEANVELLRDQLASLGCELVHASDGPSAIVLCAETNPDLCILDVSMPAGELGVDARETGFEVCHVAHSGHLRVRAQRRERPAQGDRGRRR